MTTAYGYLTGLPAPAPTAPTVPLATDVHRLPEQGPELTGPQRERVAALLAAGPVISLHDHPIRLPDPLTEQSWQRHQEAGRDVLGYAGIAESGLTTVFASALSGFDCPRCAAGSRCSAPISRTPTRPPSVCGPTTSSGRADPSR